MTARPTVPAGFARYQTLDAWRGVACLMVIVYHSTLVHAGTPGLVADVGVTGAFLWLAGYGNLGVPILKMQWRGRRTRIRSALPMHSV